MDKQPIQGEAEIWSQLKFLTYYCKRGQEVSDPYSLVQTDTKHS